MRAELNDAEREYLATARVARLATLSADGLLHVVAICPVLDGDRVVFASDAETAKVRNIQAHPYVALAFDEYVEEWTALRQVLVRGTAKIVDHGPEWDHGRGLLYHKFPQYEGVSPIAAGESVVVEVDVDQVTSWGL